ncbi:MAG TPA: hypothetical protein VE619_10075 [Nitrososphaeraceae archaeon]|nr:hypothetical protein [Nitrososphaeraceae archaeon]
MMDGSPIIINDTAVLFWMICNGTMFNQVLDDETISTSIDDEPEVDYSCKS